MKIGEHLAKCHTHTSTARERSSV